MQICGLSLISELWCRVAERFGRHGSGVAVPRGTYSAGLSMNDGLCRRPYTNSTRLIAYFIFILCNINLSAMFFYSAGTVLSKFPSLSKISLPRIFLFLLSIRNLLWKLILRSDKFVFLHDVAILLKEKLFFRKTRKKLKRFLTYDI